MPRASRTSQHRLHNHPWKFLLFWIALVLLKSSIFYIAAFQPALLQYNNPQTMIEPRGRLPTCFLSLRVKQPQRHHVLCNNSIPSKRSVGSVWPLLSSYRPHQRFLRPSATTLFHSCSGSHKHQLDSKEENDSFLSKIQSTLCHDILPQVLSQQKTNSIKKLVFLVSVSGGCDSIGLLHALLQILEKKNDSTNNCFSLPYKNNNVQTTLDCKVHVVHFDHEQRGVESDEDRRFVQLVCADHNVPCTCYSWSQQQQQEANPTFSQEAARDWRRTKSIALVKRLTGDDDDDKSVGIVLTAHHANDDMETMLFKLLRGVHITNLSGMEPMTTHDDNVFFARPMMTVNKASVASFLESRNLEWREDASNASNKYKRNRIRNELIPLLNDIVGGKDILQKRLDNLSLQSKEIKQDLTDRALEYLEKANQTSFPLPPKRLTLVHKQAIHLWAKGQMSTSDTATSFSFDQQSRLWRQLERFPNNQSWTLNMGGGWNIVRKGSVLELTCQEAGRETMVEERTLSWSVVNEEESQDREVVIQMPPNILKHKDWETKMNFIASTVEHNPGLGFVPPWRPDSAVKLGQFLRGQKIPLHRRGVAPLIVMEGPETTRVPVAVFIESNDTSSNDVENGKWILHADFHCSDKDGATRLRLRLSHTENS